MTGRLETKILHVRTLPLRTGIGRLTILFSLLGFLAACNTLEPSKRTKKRVTSPAGGAEAGPSSSRDSSGNPVDPVSSSEIVAKYRFFDPNYNFLRTSTSNLGYAAQFFPVHTAGSTQISVVQLDDLLSMRMQLLDSATRSVRVQVLIYWADDVGWLFTEKFIALKRKGIDVKIIVDPIANMAPVHQSMFFALEQAGVVVEGYDPLYTWPLVYGGSSVGGLDGIIKNADQRYHEKYLIIDAEIPQNAKAMTGGVNLSRHYFRVATDHPEEVWRDQDIVMTGSGAQTMAVFFDQNYQYLLEKRKTNGILDFDGFWFAVRSLATLLGRDDLISVTKPTPSPVMQANIPKKLAQVPRYNWHQPEYTRLFRNRPRTSEFYIEDVHLDAIRSARSSVVVDTAYFIPSPTMIEELVAAAKRGVEVRILTNSVESSEYAITGLAARAEYPQLLSVNVNPASGTNPIKLYEWQGDKILRNGEGHHHSKFMIVDEELTIVGSYNLDPRSRETSSEDVVVSYNRALAADLTAIFQGDIAPPLSKIISYEESLTFKKPSSDEMTLFYRGLIPFIRTQL